MSFSLPFLDKKTNVPDLRGLGSLVGLHRGGGLFGTWVEETQELVLARGREGAAVIAVGRVLDEATVALEMDLLLSSADVPDRELVHRDRVENIGRGRVPLDAKDLVRVALEGEEGVVSAHVLLHAVLDVPDLDRRILRAGRKEALGDGAEVKVGAAREV